MLESLKNNLHGFTQKFGTYEIKEDNISKILDELKILLIKNDVSIEVAEKIVADISRVITGTRIKRFSDKRKVLNLALKKTLLKILTPNEPFDLNQVLRNRKDPFVILFLGINGTGKTTTIAKLGSILKDQGFRIILAASDTFRAGAQEQLKKHADKIKIKILSGEKGSDSASIAYDAIQHAKARKLHAVLIDTAGRMVLNSDLMGEMEKIKRVTNPDLVILVVDSLAGNDAINQAKEFNEKIGIDGVILTKMDADAKGGAAISITYATRGKPILYIGTGQDYKDLKPFHAEEFLKILFK